MRPSDGREASLVNECSPFRPMRPDCSTMEEKRGNMRYFVAEHAIELVSRCRSQICVQEHLATGGVTTTERRM